MANSKRTRFGLVFDGARPSMMGGGFLKELNVIKAEGCEKDGRNFLVFTVHKPRRTDDVLEAVRIYNETATDKLKLVAYEGGPEVAVFDRGNCFKTHPISKVIQNLMTDETYWEWSVVIDGAKKKRAVGELESDLVEASIRPAAAKRIAVRPEEVVSEPVGEADSSSLKVKKQSKKCFSKRGSSAELFGSVTKDVVVLLVKEVTRSKDETIQTKNQIIELLMNQPKPVCAVCGPRAVAEGSP